jgi:hypothetical protein
VRYLGLRSSPAYLERLARIRVLDEPHTLVSVIGGLAFLHALSAGCRRLVLTDVDPDAEAHARLVLAMIEASDRAATFLELLTGYRVLSSWPSGEAFGEPLDALGWFRRRIPSPELFDLYRRTYGALRFDPASRTATDGRSVVRFFGPHDLTRWTFAWHFGEGCFASEQAFASLKAALERTPPCFVSTPLEAIDYRLVRDPETPLTVVLASNCESPLFTRGDAILRRIQDTVEGSLRYVSWTRDLFLPGHADGGIGDDAGATETAPAEFPAPTGRLHSMHWSRDRHLRALIEPPGSDVVRYWSVPHLRWRMPYGLGAFACTLPDRSARAQTRVLRRLHGAVVPLFRNIAIAARRDASSLARDLVDAHYARSYALGVRDVGDGRCVARLRLRGAG